MTVRTLLGVLMNLNAGLEQRGFHLMSLDDLGPLSGAHPSDCVESLHTLADTFDAQCECHQRFSATGVASGNSKRILFVANANVPMLENIRENSAPRMLLPPSLAVRR